MSALAPTPVERKRAWTRGQGGEEGRVTPRNTDACVECGGDDSEGLVLLCEECDAAHHASCVGFGGKLLGDWLCEECERREKRRRRGEGGAVETA